MPILDSRTGQQILPPNMVGLLLCTNGNANLNINGASHQFSRGTLCLISPFLFVEIVSDSDDFKWEMICDDKDVFLSLATYAFDTITDALIFKTN